MRVEVSYCQWTNCCTKSMLFSTINFLVSKQPVIKMWSKNDLKKLNCVRSVVHMFCKNSSWTLNGSEYLRFFYRFLVAISYHSIWLPLCNIFRNYSFRLIVGVVAAPTNKTVSDRLIASKSKIEFVLSIENQSNFLITFNSISAIQTNDCLNCKQYVVFVGKLSKWTS